MNKYIVITHSILLLFVLILAYKQGEAVASMEGNPEMLRIVALFSNFAIFCLGAVCIVMFRQWRWVGLIISQAGWLLVLGLAYRAGLRHGIRENTIILRAALLGKSVIRVGCLQFQESFSPSSLPNLMLTRFHGLPLPKHSVCVSLEELPQLASSGRDTMEVNSLYVYYKWSFL